MQPHLVQLPTSVAAKPSSNAQVNEILLAALEKLAAAGEVDAACRLAGQACAAFRRDDAEAWRRFNALLHRLCKRASW